MLKSAKRLGVSLIVLTSIGFSFAPASAQIIASGPIEKVDPWGVGWVGPQTGGLPSTMWSNTSADDVEEILGSLDAYILTNAQAELLRIIMMSGGKAPQGDISGATLQRLRLLRELGEGNHAASLLQRFPNEPWSEDPAKYDADLDLTSGDNVRACSLVDASSPDDPFWQGLRATCFALAGNEAGANIAAEFAISSGQEDPWLFSAIQAVIAKKNDSEMRNPPQARYDTGAAMALSLYAGLEPEADTVANLTPERAALFAERDDAPELQKIQALLQAARAGVIDPAIARRAIITPKPTMPAPGTEDLTAAQADTQQTLRNPFEHAVDTVTNPAAPLGEKARALIDALDTTRGDAADFALHAKVLLPELQSIPQTRETATLAPKFVEAAIAAQDLGMARRWRTAMDNSFVPPPPEAPAQPAMDAPQPESVGPNVLPGPNIAAPAGQPVNLAAQQTTTIPNQPADTLNQQAADLAAMQAAKPYVALPPIEHSEWDKARLDTLLLLASDNKSRNAALKNAQHLLEISEQFPEEAAQYLALLSSLGYAIPAEARQIAIETQTPRFDPEHMLEIYRLQMAQNSGASAEAVLRAFTLLTKTQPHSDQLIPYMMALDTLVDNGLQVNAKAIALEAIAPWGHS